MFYVIISFNIQYYVYLFYTMRRNFYINDELKSMISNFIYEIENYNCIISKYINLKDSKDIIIRQSFFIDRAMEALKNLNDLNSRSFKLNMNFENINNIIENVIDDFSDVFKSKGVKVNINNNICNNFDILMDRNRVRNGLLSIFMFIYNVVKTNSNINVFYDFLNYDNEDFIIMDNNNKVNNNIEKYIDVSIIFECNCIPKEVKRKLFTSPLIYYENCNFNNLYLYTAYNIIKMHSGNMWFESLKNKERINIIFPAKNKL